MLYKCPECGYVFDEPHIHTERHGFTDGMYEHWSVCPHCYEPINEECVIRDEE